MCKTYLDPDQDREKGLPCTKQLVEEFPDDPGALYLRTMVLYSAHDPAAVESDKRFRKIANPSDPMQRAELEQIDMLEKPNGQAIKQ
jgi:hypothetical protein